MTASTALRPSVRAAFGGLVDYAGLFPPAQLSLEDAWSEYDLARDGPHAWMLGRFIIPAAKLHSSANAIAGPFSVIADRDAGALSAVSALRDDAVRIEVLEIPLPDAGENEISKLKQGVAATNLADLPVFVELTRSDRWGELLAPAMEALQRHGFGAKLRCGGLTAAAFPSVGDVAAFVACAQRNRLPFKATAGLHHPVRHLNAATGFTMHGFLNLLAAAALAPRVDETTLQRIVAEEEPAAFEFDEESFSWRGERIGVRELALTRREAFVAYGSCSFAEPVDDLTALGILAR